MLFVGARRGVVSLRPNAFVRVVPRIDTHNKSTATADEGQPTAAAPDPRPFESLPAPPHHPWVGCVPWILQNGGFAKLHDVTTMLARKYGDLVRMTMFGFRNVLVSHPDFVREVYAAEGKYPNRPVAAPWDVYYTRKAAVPQNYFSMQGEAWYKDRVPINAKMMRIPQVAEWTDDFSRAADELCDLIPSLANKSTGMVDNLEQTLRLWAVESAGRMILGKSSFGALDPANETAKAFVDATDRMFKASQECTANPLYRFFRNRPYRDFEKSVFDANMLARKWITEYLATTRVEDIPDHTKIGVIQALLKGGMAVEDVAAHSVILVGGAVDTTARAMAFNLYLLGKHQDVQDAVREEIRGVVGAGNDPKTHTWSHDELQRLPLLRATMKEQMRLFPIAIANSRELSQEIVLGGYRMPANTRYIINHSGMYLDERFFPEPRKYNPSRWMTDKSPSFANVPFGHGPRMCPGRRIAETETYTLLAKLLSRYRVEINESKLGDVEGIVAVILIPDRQLEFKFVPL